MNGVTKDESTGVGQVDAYEGAERGGVHVANDNERALAAFLTTPKAIEPVADATPVPEFLTAEEAAALLRVNVTTLREVIKAASPPWAKPIGHQVRIGRAALFKWFELEVEVPAKRRRAL